MSDPASKMPRSRLGPLALESRLGDHPSQSQVWRAVHVELKRSVAVKLFSTPFGSTPESRSAFAAEWTRLQKIEHPGIVKCYGGGFEESDAYLAYELIDGETLSAQLERRNRLPWETVLDIADAIAGALRVLHERWIVHGRIVPSKIMIAGLSPILLDVRINRLDSVYRTGNPPTAVEMALTAPEVLAGGSPPTQSSDLYSLAAILYLALVGRPPVAPDAIQNFLPAGGDRRIVAATIPPPSSVIMDTPVWLDKLLLQMLSINPAARPASAEVVQLQLAETRRRSLSRTSVTAATSVGFGPLDVNNQSERDAVRKLLGHDPVSYVDDVTTEHVAWTDRGGVLIGSLVAAVVFATWMLWPLSEQQLRQRAEPLLADGTRTSLSQARNRFLQPMLDRFPDGEHAGWADSQITAIEMVQAESALQTKLKRNLQLSNEGERLYAEANRYERFGDKATALDRYLSLVTLLDGQPEYEPYVNLARRQIAAIQSDSVEQNETEAARLLQAKLDEAEELAAAGKTIAARKILYSIVELYAGNASTEPLVRRAQDRLAEMTSR